MPIYLYWGEDEFAMQQAIVNLRDRVLDPDWQSFNYDRIPPDQPNAIVQGLNQAMTPPFGAGSRLVWLVNTPLVGGGSKGDLTDAVFAELDRTLPQIPDNSVLLLTTPNKPDNRLKSTKLLQKYAAIQEFSPIPPWQTEQLAQRVRQAAQGIDLQLTPAAIAFLAEAIGNDTRQLFTDLEKLRLFAGARSQPLDVHDIDGLITSSTQNSLKLAEAIRLGNTSQALGLVADLIQRNEHALAIVATLVRQFRTWLWVKLMTTTGERDDRAIAAAADISNPKRIYYFKQEVRSLSLEQLQATLPLLFELELSLKQGAEDLPTLQTMVVRLCAVCQSR
ncbi:DNA polymerase III subunit delta [Trichothermofontia sp.]